MDDRLAIWEFVQIVALSYVFLCAKVFPCWPIHDNYVDTSCGVENIVAVNTIYDVMNRILSLLEDHTWPGLQGASISPSSSFLDWVTCLSAIAQALPQLPPEGVR